ncbi:MAG: 6-phospho-3-hexuloisomerase [Pseudomonadota bacterium]
MRNLIKVLDIILDENRKLLSGISEAHICDLVDKVNNASKIFCFAMGRSGYILRCFSMRLMHLCYPVYFVGETITPKVQAGDLLIVVSGSGETGLTYHVTALARNQGAVTYGIVGSHNSRIASELDHCLCLPGGSKIAFPGDIPSCQPVGSLFEQAAFLFFEGVIIEICSRKRGMQEDVLGHHANLE